MRYFSTNNRNETATLQEAVIRGLAPDRGLYMPEKFETFNKKFLEDIANYSFQEISLEVAKLYFGSDIPEEDLKEIVFEAINFETPVINLDGSLSVLELWHGPTLAFKDVGARFMARMLRYFLRNNDDHVHVLVATSGDTGSAVANGFLDVEGIDVTILYPSGKVSEIQEKQLTTLGHNITALEVNGVFDDCQDLVKQAFLDDELSEKLQLTSANSINIARLFPQSFYYCNAYSQLCNSHEKIVFCVPSGNFGNITSGLFARKMGLPVSHFVAATNINNVIPHYLNTGKYIPKSSIPTISNAMDVGNPSNFVRMKELFENNVGLMKQAISGYSFTDEQTKKAIGEIYSKYYYVMDPHGAVGYLAAKDYSQFHEGHIVILETAHPAKFSEVVEEKIGKQIQIPERLADCMNKEKEAIQIENNFEALKSYLLNKS